MNLTPATTSVKRFRRTPVAGTEERDGPQSDGASALVVGYGRFGQNVAQMLMAGGVPVTLIDRNVGMIDRAGEFGAKVYFGDGTRLDLLRQAGADEAEVIAFCIDGDQVGPDLVKAVHEAFPNAAIFIRGYDRRSVIRLRGTPADFVMREVMESAVVMGRKALKNLGLGEEELERAEVVFRERDKDRMKEQLKTGDVRSARHRILTSPETQGGAEN